MITFGERYSFRADCVQTISIEDHCTVSAVDNRKAEFVFDLIVFTTTKQRFTVTYPTEEKAKEAKEELERKLAT